VTVRAGILAALVAGCLSGCGSAAGEPARSAVVEPVRGHTETGMALQVEPFVTADDDPQLAQVEAWRVAMGYPVVDYHRVTADNVKGTLPDHGRIVRFARNADELSTGRGIASRFLCGAVEYEWLPGNDGQTSRWNSVRERSCPAVDPIAPGTRAVYYLITDREFGTRGIRRMRVFGPQDSELR
jgi:hypothetical protein